ncbi:hypothetical protein ERJ75_000906900 [Trypanosoma vivax]|nr:hypothetical protein ERJ75_000906900 [Trypanosoma vivax]
MCACHVFFRKLDALVVLGAQLGVAALARVVVSGDSQGVCGLGQFRQYFFECPPLFGVQCFFGVECERAFGLARAVAMMNVPMCSVPAASCCCLMARPYFEAAALTSSGHSDASLASPSRLATCVLCCVLLHCWRSRLRRRCFRTRCTCRFPDASRLLSARAHQGLA